MSNLKNYLNYILEKKQDIDISKDNLDNIYNTQIKRLSYLSYLINKEKDSDNKKKLEKIYNTLKDLSFNDGKLRSIGDLIKHIREIQRENNGRVPGIPSDDILQSLDTKMIKFEQYDDDTLEDFIDEEKSKLKDNKDAKKDKDGEKSSDSDEILNDPDTTNDEMEDYIKELKSMEGANKGMCRALCVIDITSGIDVEEPKTPEGDEGSEGDEGDEIPDELKTLLGEKLTFLNMDEYNMIISESDDINEGLGARKRKKNQTKTLTYFAYKIDNEKNPKRKAEMQKQYDTMRTLTFDDNGETRDYKDMMATMDRLKKENGGKLPVPSDQTILK